MLTPVSAVTYKKRTKEFLKKMEQQHQQNMMIIDQVNKQ